MKKLLSYLNGLPMDEREGFAKRCETTFDYLRQIGYGHRPCNATLAIHLERETQRELVCEELCPEADWQYIRANKRSGSKRRAVDTGGRRATDTLPVSDK